MAIQMASAMGARHINLTGSSVEMIKSLGAETVINYKNESMVDALKGKELSLLFDTVGGVESWEAAKGALKTDGKFITIVGDGNYGEMDIVAVFVERVGLLQLFIKRRIPPS